MFKDVFFVHSDKRSVSVSLIIKIKVSVLLHNCNQQRNLRGELERKVHKKKI